ncbi:putative flavoprotein [Desulfocurvibacter africanus PCS]|uniref:Putative flavoprotein n=1 Tax=Desulfocurvibacter africanus PCS TaxID=1262666 RepID=M5Q1L6_DESAF|nr:anaerobic nitric oxide reductase flavorubredoxin [Desulfocurvibacter africanus]EMG37681.1 putative flavoprotein [Desulfocurvibacter africanus PCS]
MSFTVTRNVTWVGKIDWELRKFHGEEYTTARGSSYNSYLVRGEKTVLVDTVWSPYDRAFVQDLERLVDLKRIDAVVVNHAEVDHSGALPELLSRIPDVPLYCSKNAVKSLTGYYHKDWNFQVVRTGDKFSLGNMDLVFIEAPMLHWPDSMFCYLTEDNILFSNDAFGQHYASEFMYDDLVDPCELFDEALKYYANILTPFSPSVRKKIDEIKSMNVPLDLICPSHGVIWRSRPMNIVEKYEEWADDYQEDQITLLYDTMWNATRVMAEAIAEGIRAASPSTEVKLYNIARSDRTVMVTDVFRSKAVLVGSSTINNGILSSVAGILEEIRGMKFKQKKAAAFGSYGWSGESVKLITQHLREGGFELVNDGFKLLWQPGEEGREQCRKWGREFVNSLG